MTAGIFSYLISRGRTILQMNDAAETLTAAEPDGQLRLYHDSSNGFIQVFAREIGASGQWDRFSPDAVLVATYAPIDADFLVGTANASLTGEIVAGTAPSGEVGGTWGSITVNGTHSGSAHHNESHALDAVVHTGQLPFTDLSGTISDTQHGTVSQANAHAHSDLSGVTSDQHHAQNHATRHSDGGADEITVENLATSGAAGTVVTSDGAGGLTMSAPTSGMDLVHSDNTGGSTPSTTEADIVDVTGLSIPALHGIRIECNIRVDNNSAAARTANFGLHLNGTSMFAASEYSLTSAAGQDNSGSMLIDIPARATNYDNGGVVHFTGSTAAISSLGVTRANAFPTATITSITFRGNVTGADALAYVNHIRIWELAD